MEVKHSNCLQRLIAENRRSLPRASPRSSASGSGNQKPSDQVASNEEDEGLETPSKFGFGVEYKPNFDFSVSVYKTIFLNHFIVTDCSRFLGRV